MSRRLGLRAALLALVLASLVVPARAQEQNPCADDECGCPHEQPVSACCCDEDTVAGHVEVPPARTREELLNELRTGRRATGPVLNDLGCRKARRALAEARGTAPSACGPMLAATWSPTRGGCPRARPVARAFEFEPEPSIPPPRDGRA